MVLLISFFALPLLQGDKRGIVISIICYLQELHKHECCKHYLYEGFGWIQKIILHLFLPLTLVMTVLLQLRQETNDMQRMLLHSAAG